NQRDPQRGVAINSVVQQISRHSAPVGELDD
ncbi:MAG: hypothetical protein RL751_1935, partial [Bacteroidota bacterium]